MEKFLIHHISTEVDTVKHTRQSYPSYYKKANAMTRYQTLHTKCTVNDADITIITVDTMSSSTKSACQMTHM